jgi:dihydrofolate reductase
MIIGRSTYEAIGRPLSGRRMIILTRDKNYKAPGSIVVHTIEQALKVCPSKEVVWVAGGSEIYKQMLWLCDTLHLTEVKTNANGGGVYFPDQELDTSWSLLEDEGWQKEEQDDFKTCYRVYGKLASILSHCGFDPWAGTVSV